MLSDMDILLSIRDRTPWQRHCVLSWIEAHSVLDEGEERTFACYGLIDRLPWP